MEEIQHVTWDLDGTELAEWQAIQRLYRAGFQDMLTLGTMFAIIEGESGSYTRAWHANVTRTTDNNEIVRDSRNGIDFMCIESIDLGFIQYNVKAGPQWIAMTVDAMAIFVDAQFAKRPELADAQLSSEIAHDLFIDRGFQPWYAYKPGTIGFYQKKRRAAKAIGDWYLRTQVGRLAHVSEDGGNFPRLKFIDQS
jgi:hypothetical protein